MNLRQKEQQAFDNSGENIIVGEEKNCPLSLQELVEITESSPFVVNVIRSGLTAEVFHLRIDGKEYNLKKRRQKAKVANLDGQYSFLNEVQRRRDLQRLKEQSNTAVRLTNIVSTLYANYRLGIILSPWIEGKHVQELTPLMMEHLFETLQTCEEHGLMEWDLCSGNLLVDKNLHIWLFDFGYMYPFNPKTEFNSNGVVDPLFHLVERFETRFFFGWLLQGSLSYSQQIEIYRQLKQAAIKIYEQKIDWLKENDAQTIVTEHFKEISSSWQVAMKNDTELEKLFLLESFRSHVLDIEDDIEGQSCTPLTLKRIVFVQKAINEHFDYLLQLGGFFYGNEGKTQQQLQNRYREKMTLAQKYLL